MEKKTIVIADDEPITRMDIKEILQENGYDVIGEASNGLESLNLARKLKPNLVMMDIKMPNLDGLKATKLIVDEDLTDAVIILSAYSGREFIEEAKTAGVLGYLIKPIDEKSLIPEIEIAIAKGIELKKIKEEAINIKKQIEKFKLIDKAKRLLMNKHKISEEEAYKRLRKCSMNNRCTIEQVATDIISDNI